MRIARTRTAPIALIVALALVVVACGGDDAPEAAVLTAVSDEASTNPLGDIDLGDVDLGDIDPGDVDLGDLDLEALMGDAFDDVDVDDMVGELGDLAEGLGELEGFLGGEFAECFSVSMAMLPLAFAPMAIGFGASFADVEGDLSEMDEALEELAGMVPAEARGAVDQLSVLAQEARAASSLDELAGIYESPRWEGAFEELEQWFEANCDFD